MAIRERLVYAIDVVTDGANKGIANFRSSVSEADGAVGKFKAGASSALTTIQAHAGTLAIAGGAALVTFGAKAVAAFQDTAIEAGKFSDATGLAVEDASRWIEVAGDVGVSAETMQGAFVRLNKAIGSGNPELKKWGVGLITAADGTADVNQTMLTAIERIGKIKDPTERAAAAQAAFGRSYAEAAEIIFDNADNVKKKLDEVSDAKVIDEQELAKARKFRETMDNLQDSLEDITLVVGEALVPVLEDLASGINTVKSAADKLGVLKYADDFASWLNPVKKIGDQFRGPVTDGIKSAGSAIKGWFGGGGEAPKAFEATTTAVDQYVESLEQMHAAARETSKAAEEQADTLRKARGQADSYVSLLQQRGLAVLRDVAEALDRARRSNQLLADSQRDLRQATLESLDTMFDYEKSVMATEDAVSDLAAVVKESPDDWRAIRDAQIGSAEAALTQAQNFASAKGAIEGSTTAAHLQRDELERLKAKFPELAELIQGYIDKLNAIPSVKSTQLVVTSSGGVTTKQTSNKFGRLVAGAEGAIVNQPTLALIGEAGPEAVVPLGQSPGNSPLPRGVGGGSTFQITVHAGMGTDGRLVGQKIVEAITAWERSAGKGWRS